MRAPMSWAYVAGYFDGEGTVGNHQTTRGDRTRCLAWYNTHRDSLEAMRAFMGCGIVSIRHPKGLGKLTAYALQINRKADLLLAIDGMLPHLIIKHDRAVALRAYLVEHVDDSRMTNFGKVAALSDVQLRVLHFTQDKTIGVIATELGVTSAAVSAEFKRRGIATKPRRSRAGIPKSAETRERMKAAAQRRFAKPAT